MSRKVDKATKERSKLTKEEWREFTKTVWHIANVADPNHPAVFPEEIPRRLVKLFTFEGELVLDPFAGTGPTASAALALRRRAICVDQNPKYVRLIRDRVGLLATGEDGQQPSLTTKAADSRDLSFVPNGAVQLIVTSPPYWNKANYGSRRTNLGAIEGYNDFLDEIEQVFRECFRVLEPGRKMCVVTANVNQHTDHGLLSFPLAADFIVRMRQVGFVLVNEVVWSKDRTGGKWGSWGKQRPIFGSYPYPPNFLFKTVHEYIIIAAKPASAKSRGPKVKNYASLMASNVRRA